MIRAYIDGGARGNPGPAGYGVRIERADGTLLDELFGGLGITTNNVDSGGRPQPRPVLTQRARMMPSIRPAAVPLAR
jgi:hypothetical protein